MSVIDIETVYRRADRKGLTRRHIENLLEMFGSERVNEILNLIDTSAKGQRGNAVIAFKALPNDAAKLKIHLKGLATRIAENDAKIADLQRDQTQIRTAIKERQFDRAFPGMRIPVDPDEGKKQQYISMLNRVFPSLFNWN